MLREYAVTVPSTPTRPCQKLSEYFRHSSVRLLIVVLLWEPEVANPSEVGPMRAALRQARFTIEACCDIGKWAVGATWAALCLAPLTIKVWPYRWAGAVAASGAGAALVAICLHLLFGLADTTSIIIATVLGLLALAVAVLAMSAVAMLRLAQAVRQAPPSAPPGYVTPGNLPSAPVPSDIPGVQPDGSAEAPEVWE
jgi:hypothetical protein